MKIGFLMQEGVPLIWERPLPGPANHVWQVFKELQRLGHQVRLLVRFDGRLWRSDNLEDFEPVQVPRFDTGLLRFIERMVRGLQSRLHLPYANLFESLRFAEACRQEFGDYDLFFERMGWMGYGGGLAAGWLQKPLVYEVNNGDFITELERLGVAPTGFQRWLAIALMRRAAHRATHVVATGQGHGRRFIEWWEVDPARVSVVENGSELVGLLSREQLPAFHPETDPAQKGITIVFVGAFEPWHGILNLIPAMARVVAEISTARLILIGSGTEWDNIVQLIRQFDMQDRVELTGKLNIHQVADYLAGADIGVAPYCGWMEFSGLKLFDYKAAGLAIVASGQDGQPATLEHGCTAWIVPPCDEEALSEAMIGLASDPEQRRKMGQAARIEAEQFHSWQHTAEQLQRIFAEVLTQ